LQIDLSTLGTTECLSLQEVRPPEKKSNVIKPNIGSDISIKSVKRRT